MKRVIIIGSSGAGKTTLARELSKKLNIPHTELDSIFNQPNWTRREPDEFIKDVNKIANGDEWVFCGNYYSRLGKEFWMKADTVIWCDYSFPLVLKRLVGRTFVRSIDKRELWNGNRENFRRSFFSRKSIIVWMLTTWKKQQARYTQLFNNPDEFPTTKLIRLRSPKQTRSFLQHLS